jgi:hypothetical protein
MATSARDFALDISHYLAIYFSKQYGDVAVCYVILNLLFEKLLSLFSYSPDQGVRFFSVLL